MTIAPSTAPGDSPSTQEAIWDPRPPEDYVFLGRLHARQTWTYSPKVGDLLKSGCSEGALVEIIKIGSKTKTECNVQIRSIGERQETVCWCRIDKGRMDFPQWAVWRSPSRS